MQIPRTDDQLLDTELLHGVDGGGLVGLKVSFLRLSMVSVGPRYSPSPQLSASSSFHPVLRLLHIRNTIPCAHPIRVGTQRTILN